MPALRLRVRRVRKSAAPIPLPRYQSEHAAGMDLAADIDEPVTLAPLERRAIPTGLAVEIPPGYEGQVRPRSGLALKHGIGCLNAPGTIDADYRGEIQVLLVNLSNSPFSLKRGDRVAQFIVAPVAHAEWLEVEALEESSRGGGGFGSTGV
jgi:dUTP pyrophosphatase